MRQVAQEMLFIFKAQKIEREALAALRVFCDAAKQEAATAELVRRVERFLRRAQVDPEVRFEEERKGGERQSDRSTPFLHEPPKEIDSSTR